MSCNNILNRLSSKLFLVYNNILILYNIFKFNTLIVICSAPNGQISIGTDVSGAVPTRPYFSFYKCRQKNTFN